MRAGWPTPDADRPAVPCPNVFRRACAGVVAAVVALGGCTRPVDLAAGSPAESGPPTTPAAQWGTMPTSTTTIPPVTTVPPTTTTTTITTTTTTTTATTTVPVPDRDAPATRAAFGQLAGGNLAASLTLRYDGVPLVQLSSGTTNGGAPVTADTPMVVASVSKLVTALTVARLVQQGVLAADTPVPWETMGFVTDPAWATVTVQDLLDHTSGMPIARKEWLDDPGSCAIPLGAVLAAAPTPARGTWVYSNGNYCALGLLIESVTGERYDAVARRLVLEPAGIAGPHLTIDGSGPDDAPYSKGVARFDRLGAAGQWMISTDDVATMLAAVTAADRDVLVWPGVIADQYGWGHTGSVDGAVSCAWTLGGGRAIVAATVAGGRPSSGGGVCDLVVPAVAADVGLPYLGEPDRIPQ